MKSRVKITNTGGSWFDSEADDTIRFKVSSDPRQFVGFPEEGTNIKIRLFDSSGERHSEVGNTHFTIDSSGVRRRPKPLTVKELIKDLLNLP